MDKLYPSKQCRKVNCNRRNTAIPHELCSKTSAVDRPVGGTAVHKTVLNSLSCTQTEGTITRLYSNSCDRDYCPKHQKIPHTPC